MRRIAILALIAFALAASSAQAQKKQKDQVLEQYLIAEFAKLNAKLDGMAERVATAEAEIARLKQGHAELMTEVRSNLTVVKTTDTSLSTFRLSTQQDLFSLKTDLTQIRQDLAKLSEAVKGAQQAAAPPPVAPPATEGARLEGYITSVSADEKEVNINLGSNAGVRIGSEFSVFKSTDPKTQVGIIEIVEVIDGINSRAKVVYLRAPNRLDFSDVVRPRS